MQRYWRHLMAGLMLIILSLAPAGRDVIQVACEQAQDPLAHKK